VKTKKKGVPSPKARGAKTRRKAPEKPFRLEVGKTYENKTGDLRVKIARKHPSYTYPMNGKVLAGQAWLNDWTEAGWYFENGPGDKNDLVREVPASAKRPAKPAPKPSVATSNESLVRRKK
jgi:hypothetical protein